ncbi:PAAR domain-containing protein [Acinetobacter rudis]|uniref:PAAR domain-containing protein n=1 Tax=Acinetobacter rudis TaxID=632955 RepID=A0AAW8JCY9_9GAMM|nr:PAAR domain-containing protein [Acinetobacter rudis]MDQ8937064.1 PAAR domain-containing protein [Acinetobacter rudis]MDQ9019289.1 PAAR domain-containing protein [Acinetobacter rudis]
MTKSYITVGCLTTGGGEVLTGNSRFLIGGVAVACIGDTASCPLHQTISTIISGDPHLLIFNKPAAQVNDLLSCGCKLLAKQKLVSGDHK